MADTAVTERRIRLINDALEAGNVKQAIKECEKWQKKGEASDRFLALKAAVLLRSHDRKQWETGHRETLELCHRASPVLNLDAIHQLQDSLKLMRLGHEGKDIKLWERAATARPQDEELVTTWLNNSMSKSDWQDAQKATTTLRKSFPRDHKYDYWNVLMCYLISQDRQLPEQTQKLFGTLATRMISKAAQDKSDKGVSSTEELVLLAKVLLNTGSASELIELFSSEALQSVIEQDRLTADKLLLEAVKAKDNVADTIVFLDKRLYRDSDVLTEDDSVWFTFLSTCQNPGTIAKGLDFTSDKLKQHPNHRQALLAQITLLSRQPSSGEDTDAELIRQCKQYFDLFGTKAFCFDDLSVHLQSLGLDFARKFEQELSTTSTTERSQVHQLFMLKLHYFLLFHNEILTSEALQFTASALQLCQTAKEHPSVAAESALLAALSLLRTAASTGEATYRHQASLILHTTCTRYKDYYPLRILLVQVQMSSGQIHLAMNNFFELSVKNLQWETLGHYILTRISTLHPQQYGHGEESLNPLGALDTALTVFENARKSLDKSIRDGLRRYQSYANVLDTIQLRKQLQASIVAKLYAAEDRKCRRMLGLTVRAKIEDYGDLTDLRDTSFMPRYGVEQGKLDTYLQCGPRPGAGWLKAMILHEHLIWWLQAEADLMQGSNPVEALVYMQMMAPSFADRYGDLTEAEQGAYAVYRELVKHAEPGMGKHSKVDGALARYKSCDWSAAPVDLNGVKCPDWRYVHTQYVRLEVLQTSALFATALTKKIKTGKDKNKVADLKQNLDSISSCLDQEVEEIYRQARECKEQLSASGVLGRLVDAVLGRANSSDESTSAFAHVIGQLQDEASVEEYCGMMRESWEDVLDGILAVKVRIA